MKLIDKRAIKTLMGDDVTTPDIPADEMKRCAEVMKYFCKAQMKIISDYGVKKYNAIARL